MALLRRRLADAQVGVWFAQQRDQANPIYNTGEYVELHGTLDPAIFESALRQVLAEAEALHMRFIEDADGIWQEYAPAQDWPLHRVDLRGAPDPRAMAELWMQADLAKTTDLTQGPLFTQALFQIADASWLWYQRIHHIAIDAFGLALIERRVAEVYSALVRGADSTGRAFAPLQQLLDEQAAYRSSPQRNHDRAYWLEHFTPGQVAPSLAGSSALSSNSVLRQRAQLAPTLVQTLQQLAQTAQASWPDLALATVALYLHRMTGVQEVVLGLPMMGRMGSAALRIPSIVVNVLPLRLQLRPGMTLRELAQQVTQQVRAAARHQRYRYEDLIRDLRLVSGERQLFGPLVNILPFDSTLRFAGQPATAHNLAAGPVDDLSIAIITRADGSGMQIDLDANPALYEAGTLATHLRRLVALFEAIAARADVDLPIGQGDLLLDEELQQLRAATQQAVHQVPSTTIAALLEQRAAATPNTIAAVFGAKQLSYAALNARANQLARTLIANGVGPERVVALALPRSLDLLVAIFAVLKAGGAYLPLDPSLPTERLAWIIADAQPVCALASSATAAQLPAALPQLLLESAALAETLERTPGHDLADHERLGVLTAHNSAYLIYTSGSTGTPKGVVVEQASLVNLFFCHQSERIAPALAARGGYLRVAHLAPFSFDASWDPLLWMLGGGELHLLDNTTILDPQALLEYVHTQRIDYLDTTPSYLQQLVSQGLLDQARHQPLVIVAGGEAMPPALWAELTANPTSTCYNLYGPTEATVDVYVWQAGDHGAAQGRTIWNTQAYLLDGALQPVPPGVVGELYLGGAALARGYLNRPDLTAERFIPNPFATHDATWVFQHEAHEVHEEHEGSVDQPNQSQPALDHHAAPQHHAAKPTSLKPQASSLRFYRTGDLARWAADGTLQFVGRADDQVKLRGFRIEPGEIAAVLAQHDAVAQAAVVLREDMPGEPQLVAYVVPKANTHPDSHAAESTSLQPQASSLPNELRTFLQQRLPAYMVPSAFMLLALLPLHANGKLARSALPRPAQADARDRRPPRNERERALCQLFAELLGLAEVGIDDSFFELGGHSLLAAKLVAQARTTLGLNLTIGQVFELPSVAQLADRLVAQPTAQPQLRPLPRSGALPLSFAQRRFWFLHQLEGPSPTYNLPLVLRLNGVLDIPALQAALGDLLARHEVLRMTFCDADGVPQLQVRSAAQAVPALPVVAVAPGALDQALREAGRYAFDLSRELPLRATLFSTGPHAHVLLLLLHHIAGDGWSLSPLSSDLAAAYRARSAAAAPGWQPLAVQYADYAAWQYQLLGDEQHHSSLAERQLDFWRGALAGLPDQLELPFDRPRPPVASYRGNMVPLQLAPALHQQLHELARSCGATVFMALQAGLAALLTRLGAGTDIPLGSPTAGRSEPALNDLIGCFVNTLVLRTDTAGNPSFRELLARVRAADTQAFAHQDLPFERLVEALRPTRSLARHPLFQVMLAFQQANTSDLGMPQLQTQLQALHIGAAKFDLLLNLNERRSADGEPQGIAGFLEYSTDLFEHATAATLGARLLRLLAAAVAAPDQPIGMLDLLSDEERQQLLSGWVNTAHPVASETLTSAFQAQVARTPQAPAVVFEGQQLSYAQLNAAANQLAHLLIGQGVGPESIVAVALPRSFELIVALYATHKTGAAYLPIDPDYPADRIAFMLDDAQPACVLATSQIAAGLPPLAAPVLQLDTPALSVLLSGQPSSNPTDHERTAALEPQHPAYVIYTSGSTGRPKGVMVPHVGIVNRLRWMQAAYRLTAADRVLQKTPSSFDVSVWEFFWPLLEGATLVVARPDGHKDPAYLAELIQAERITTIHFVPSMLQVFLQEPRAAGCGGLRRVICSGEALPAELVAQFFTLLDVPLHNLYGPTEASVDVTFWECQPHATTSIPIGFPVWNTGLRILDAQLQPVPVGVPGVLYLTGVQLARGYLKRPALTAERFLPDPYGPPGSRMYHTGDLARWRPDGAVEYLGRIDHQVKIRGFRIELGEIEALLAQHDDVAQVAVIAREDRPGDRRLVAYIVPAALGSYDPVQLRRHLAASLPEYMIPAAFVTLPALPLSPNGKLDRAALPMPDLQTSAGGRPPHTPQEAVLRDLFAEVLGLPAVGNDDNFFEHGGHSLLAVQLISRIRATLGVELSIGSLFQSPTVAGLAEALAVGADLDALEVLLPLRGQGDSTPLFCFHPAGGLSWCYTGLMRQLGPQRPIYGVQARGVAAPAPLPSTLEALVDDYIAQLRRVQPNGPYHLLGWSTGGIIAHAVATTLQAIGASVASLTIMDAYPAVLMRGLPDSDDIEALEALLIMAGYSLDIMGDQPLEFARVLDVLRGAGSPLASLDQATILRLKQIYLNINRIVRAFDHRLFHGDLLFFRAMVETVDEQLTAETWRPYVSGQIVAHEIACSHKDMTHPGPLAEIGALIAAMLEQNQVDEEVR